jgi:membrane protein required for colicin V production
MQAFDIIALVVIGLSSIMAFARGLIREVFSIVAFFAALIAALTGHRLLLPYLDGMIQNPLVASVVSGILIFLIVYVAITILTGILAKAAHSSGEIGALDRGGGLIYGFARGFLIIAVAVVMVRSVTGPSDTTPQAAQPEWLTKAQTYPYFERAAVVLEGLVPQFNDYMKKRHEAGKSVIPGLEKPLELPTGQIVSTDEAPPPPADAPAAAPAEPAPKK